MIEPAYIKIRKQRRREWLTKFLLEAFVTDETELESVNTISEFVNEGRHDATEAQSLCEYLELGEWFVDEMEACDFDVDDFLVEYEAAIKERIREMSDEWQIWPNDALLHSYLPFSEVGIRDCV